MAVVPPPEHTAISEDVHQFTRGPLVQDDPDLYDPSAVELDFLHQTINSDDDALKKTVLDFQREALRLGFIRLRMSKALFYNEIVAAGKLYPDAILLDLGCCLGTDLRKAVLDGYPPEKIVGCDVLHEFLELGHQLWNDKHSCRIKFIADDIFNISGPLQVASNNPSSNPSMSLSEVKGLKDLLGRVKFLFTHSVFHIFNEEKQKEMALNLALLSARTPGSIIFGGHIGAEKMGFTSGPLTVVDTMFAHSPESWKALWIDTFTIVEGANFAKSRVVVNAKLVKTPLVTYLAWSVRFV